jgi:hypothetical protein
MTDYGVPDSDMTVFPWPARPDNQVLEALLSGACPPEDAPGELRPVAEVLVALQAPPDQREAAGWGQALAEYREMTRRPETPGRRLPRRKARPASLLATRLAAAAGAAAIAVLGGGAAAAYTGNLPAALQKIAHETIAAPDRHDGSATPTTRGSDHSARATVTGAPVARPGPATSPGRRVGQTSSPANPGRGRKPTAPPGQPSTAPAKPSIPPGQASKATKQPGKPSASPGNGNGGGNGNGNSNGKQ